MLLRRLLVFASAVTSAAAACRSTARPAFVSSAQRNALRPLSRSPSMQASAAGSAGAAADGNSSGGLFLFDFDGVVCDSCDECTVAALQTCRQLGMLDTDAFVPGTPPPWLLGRMREIRPAIEVGWQIPVLLAVLVEQEKKAAEIGPAVPVMSTEDVMLNYETLVSGALDRWGKTDRDMIDAFGEVRDAWMANDLMSWLEANTFYLGVPDALSACRGEAVVVTTKQQRFAIALMRHAGVEAASVPDGDIYGLGMYKTKSDVIVDRMAAGGYRAEETHFFEDRWPTLAKCLQDDRLEGVRFYLCDWGYVAPQELKLAKAESRVDVLGLDRFKDIVTAS